MFDWRGVVVPGAKMTETYHHSDVLIIGPVLSRGPGSPRMVQQRDPQEIAIL